VVERPRLYHLLWLPLARVFVGLFFFLTGPFKIRGAYRVPKTGPVLILANHISDLDPPMVQFSCPRPMRFMAKSELFDVKVLGPLLRFFGAFPVKRGEPDRNSIRLAVEYLKSGEAVGIFPEGQLSETGELQELKGGVALIIRMAACPVICCGLKNFNRVLPYGSLFPRPAFRTLHVNWGESREFTKESTTEEILEWVHGQLKMLSE
jgi:1-acyl-sn-glycerol-3-phosphate acyltransferase